MCYGGLELIKVVNKRWDRGANSVYIGRPSVFGNPFSHMDDTIAKYKVSNRQEAIDKYKIWFDDQMMNNQSFNNEFEKLYQQWKTNGVLYLACWCKPANCHGDYILEKLEAYDIIVGTSFD